MLTIQLNPFPVLESERLIFRRYTYSDAPDMFAIRSDARNYRYIDKQPPKDIAEMERLVDTINEGVDTNQRVAWVICLKEDPKMIGGISYHRTILQHHRAEIGYQLAFEHWNKGYITEALKTIIGYGFNTLKFHSLEANVNPNNAASIRVLEKQGFVREAYFKEDYFFNGTFLDSAIYSLLNPNG